MTSKNSSVIQGLTRHFGSNPVCNVFIYQLDKDFISCYLEIRCCYAWSSSSKFGTHTCIKEHRPIMVSEIRADHAPPIGILIDPVISSAHLDAKLTVH